MKFFDLFTKNPHDAGFEQVNNAKFWVAIEQEFSPKPYEQENKDMYQFAFAGGFLCNAISAATAATHVFVFLSALIPFTWLSGGLTAVILFFLEGAKRYTAPKLFKQFLQYKKLPVGFLLVSLGLMGLSTTFSYLGAKKVIFATAEKPKLKDVSAIQEHYKKEKAKIQSQMEDVSKHQSWKQTLTPVGQKSYQTLTNQQNALLEAEQKELEQANVNNTILSSASEVDTGERANYFAAFTALIEVILLICLFYTVYFRYRSFAERTKVAQTAANHYKDKEISDNRQLTEVKEVPQNTPNVVQQVIQPQNREVERTPKQEETANETPQKEVKRTENAQNEGKSIETDKLEEIPQKDASEADSIMDTSTVEMLLIPSHISKELQKEMADKIRAIQRERNKVTTAEWRLRNKQGLEKTNKANIEKGNEELKRLREELAVMYAKAHYNGKTATLFES